MKLLGFSFNKIGIERLSYKTENLNINTKIDILSIEEAKSEAFKFKEESLAIHFLFNIDYSPNIAKLVLEGNLILALDSKVYKEVQHLWKEKKLPEDFRISLFNLILKKSTLKALQLEEELNLPPHIPLPSFKKPEKDAKTDPSL